MAIEYMQVILQDLYYMHKAELQDAIFSMT